MVIAACVGRTTLRARHEALGQSLHLEQAIGAIAVELSLHFRGDGILQAADFPPAFLAVAGISALSALIFLRLPHDAGAELANRLPAPTETTAQRGGCTACSILASMRS